MNIKRGIPIILFLEKDLDTKLGLTKKRGEKVKNNRTIKITLRKNLCQILFK